jgi:hypothetical protein
MAVLVNWFQVSFDQDTFEIPSVIVPSWIAARDLCAQDRAAETVKIQNSDDTVSVVYVTESPQKSSIVPFRVTPRGPIPVLARIVEYNFVQHFSSSSIQSGRDRWKAWATKAVERFDEAGLSISVGIEAKYFGIAEPRQTSGITLNWAVRPTFDRSLAQMPKGFDYGSFPVLLKWPTGLESCPTEILPFNQRYIGTIIEKRDDSRFLVAVRDLTEKLIDARALVLESRPDVIAGLEKMTGFPRGKTSIQRRILELSHALRADGRRNPAILRDQLKSALKMLDPTGRGQVAIDLAGNCRGRIWIDCRASGAKKMADV